MIQRGYSCTTWDGPCERNKRTRRPAINRTLKQGDRVRVTVANQVPRYRPGQKGTVVWEVVSTVRGKLYAVMMDRDDPKGTCPVFAAAEIEADGQQP